MSSLEVSVYEGGKGGYGVQVKARCLHVRYFSKVIEYAWFLETCDMFYMLAFKRRNKAGNTG